MTVLKMTVKQVTNKNMHSILQLALLHHPSSIIAAEHLAHHNTNASSANGFIDGRNVLASGTPFHAHSFPLVQVSKTVHWDPKVLPHELIQRAGVTQEVGGGCRAPPTRKECPTKSFMKLQSVAGEVLPK